MKVDSDPRSLRPPAHDDRELRISLGPMPADGRMRVVDERVVNVPLYVMFAIAADVVDWPKHLKHYRYVKFRSRSADGGGIVEMSASRPFGWLRWPTWWVSAMVVHPPGGPEAPSIRFHHIEGITRGMDVAWEFEPAPGSMSRVRIVHVWNGPRWPGVGGIIARRIIGPVFVHGIASRTLAGLATVAERARS